MSRCLSSPEQPSSADAAHVSMPVMTPRLVSQGHPAAGVAAPREPPSPHTYTTDGSELSINNSKRDPEPKGTGHTTPGQSLREDISSLTVVSWGRREVQHSGSSAEWSVQHSYSAEMSLGEQQVSSYNAFFRKNTYQNLLFQFLSAAAVVRMYLQRGTNHQNCSWHKSHSTK